MFFPLKTLFGFWGSGSGFLCLFVLGVFVGFWFVCFVFFLMTIHLRLFLKSGIDNVHRLSLGFSGYIQLGDF